MNSMCDKYRNDNFEKKRILYISKIMLLIFLSTAVILMFSACKDTGFIKHGDGAKGTGLSVTGDVKKVVGLKAEDDGILLAEAVERAGSVTEKASVYLRGGDGMMASMDINELGENYLTYGDEGWEAVGVDSPPSFNVKSLTDIVVVADNPAEVDASVVVSDERGIQRLISPGTLVLMPQTSKPDFQGESEKNGRHVSVYTTDKYYVIGNTVLRLDGNRIVKEEQNDR